MFKNVPSDRNAYILSIMQISTTSPGHYQLRDILDSICGSLCFQKFCNSTPTELQLNSLTVSKLCNRADAPFAYKLSINSPRIIFILLIKNTSNINSDKNS